MRRTLYLMALAAVLVSTVAWVLARHLSRSRPAAPIVLFSGSFHQVAHKGRGVATIYQLPGGKRVLSLTDFHTYLGQDLQVCLIGASDAFENEIVEKAGFISLGALASNEGEQSYDLPADLDLSKYKAVTVWSAKYRVNFTTAPLQP